MGRYAESTIYVGIEITKEKYIELIQKWIETMDKETVENYERKAKKDNCSLIDYLIERIDNEDFSGKFDFEIKSFKYKRNYYEDYEDEEDRHSKEKDRYLFLWYFHSIESSEGENFMFVDDNENEPDFDEEEFKSVASDFGITGKIIKVLSCEFNE